MVGIVWENTIPDTELPRIFCAEIGPLELGAVLVLYVFIIPWIAYNTGHRGVGRSVGWVGGKGATKKRTIVGLKRARTELRRAQQS